MKEKTKTWKPNLFVVGFQKSGSTALCDYLAQHSEVFLAEPKEPMGLRKRTKLPTWQGGKNNFYYLRTSFEEYKKIFEGSENKKYRIDGSQAYAEGGLESAKKIKEFNPNAKILFILRDHIKRAFSSFSFYYPKHKISSIEKYLPLIEEDLEKFLFLNSIKDYYSIFGKDVLVVRSSDLRNDENKVLKEVFEWLNLPVINVKRLSSNPSINLNLEPGLRKKILCFLVSTNKNLGLKIAEILKSLNLYYGNKTLSWLREKCNPINFSFKIIQKLAPKKIKTVSDYKLPKELENTLIKDYEETISFCKKEKILLFPDL
jgi:hypothetical protein